MISKNRDLRQHYCTLVYTLYGIKDGASDGGSNAVIENLIAFRPKKVIMFFVKMRVSAMAGNFSLSAIYEKTKKNPLGKVSLSFIELKKLLSCHILMFQFECASCRFLTRA